MGVGMAVVIWIVMALVVTGLFTLSSRGRGEIWTLCVGLALLAILLGLIAASPRPVPASASGTQPVVAPRADATATVTATEAPTTTPTRPPDPTTAPTSTSPATRTVSPTAPTAATTIASATVGASAEAQPPTTTTAAPLSVVRVQVPGANIRSTPEVGDNLVGEVSEGDELVVLERRDDWLLVRLGTNVSPESTITDGQGWIASRLVAAP